MDDRADEDAHLPALDILIAEGAHFPYAQAGRVHEGDHGLLLDAGHGGLQVRIVKATLEQKWRLVKRLQYLLPNSLYAKAVS